MRVARQLVLVGSMIIYGCMYVGPLQFLVHCIVRHNKTVGKIHSEGVNMLTTDTHYAY